MKIDEVLLELKISSFNLGSSTGIEWLGKEESPLPSVSPVDGKLIAQVYQTGEESYESIVLRAQFAFQSCRVMPAPKRGEIVRQIGNKLREKKEALGTLVSYEMGKSLQEGFGEVQEMIDI